MKILRMLALAGILAVLAPSCAKKCPCCTGDDVRISWECTTQQVISSIPLMDGSVCENLYYPGSRPCPTGVC